MQECNRSTLCYANNQCIFRNAGFTHQLWYADVIGWQHSSDDALFQFFWVAIHLLLSHQKIEEDFLVPRQHDANVQSPYGLLPVSIMLAGTSQSYYAPSSHTTLQEEATSILTQGAFMGCGELQTTCRATTKKITHENRRKIHLPDIE